VALKTRFIRGVIVNPSACALANSSAVRFRTLPLRLGTLPWLISPVADFANACIVYVYTMSKNCLVLFFMFVLFKKIKNPLRAHEVSAAVTHRTRYRKVLNSTAICNNTSKLTLYFGSSTCAGSYSHSFVLSYMSKEIRNRKHPKIHGFCNSRMNHLALCLSFYSNTE